ncbi:MYXO-CTERM sorting domain-containing protein [Terrabacter sp. NPDC080008]|uniref:MYXO-CTERM sorting domain-containing protein n=1 Tax=Terrabacter sp. NPDC080008 TaxID=3155176 RepID=UPI00344DEAD9
MSRSHVPVRSSVTVAGCAVVLAAGLTVVASSTGSALTLPSPVTSSTPTAAGAPTLPGVSGLVGRVTAPLTSSTSPGLPAVPPLPAGSPTSLPSLPAPPSAPSLGAVGSGVKSGLAAAKSKAAGTPLATAVPGAGPGGVLKLGVNAAPLATACAQVTGSGTAVANTTLTVAGHNVSAPVVQALPGLLAECPRGSVPKSPGLDASVSGLVGACVRVTPKAPLHASVLVLDTELIRTLTRSGVPLQQAVVPCPAGAAHVVGGSPAGNHGGAAGAGTAARPTGSKSSAAGAAAGHGSAKGSGAACAPGGADGTSLDARTTAAGILPHDAPQALPWLLLALALVGRRRLGRMVTALRGARSAG